MQKALVLILYVFCKYYILDPMFAGTENLCVYSISVVDPHGFQCGYGSSILGKCGSRSSSASETRFLMTVFVVALLDPDPAGQNQCRSIRIRIHNTFIL